MKAPITSLPWTSQGVSRFIYQVNDNRPPLATVVDARDARYIAHAANAYPKLVAALQEIRKYLSKEERTLDQHVEAMLLLRSLGEES